MSSSLIAALKGIEDYRAPRGQRYPLWLILLLVVLGTLSECYGYQALEEFCIRHYAALCEHLGMTVKRLPSDSTFRRLFEQLDFQKLTHCFEQWAKEDVTLQPGEWRFSGWQEYQSNGARTQSVLPKLCQLGVGVQSSTRSCGWLAAI